MKNSTTKNYKKLQAICFRPTKALRQFLDREAKSTGINRSAIINLRLLNQYRKSEPLEIDHPTD